MTSQRWLDVERYLNEHLVSQDPVLDAAVRESEAAGLPPIQVAPNEGMLLMLLAQLRGAQRILEIGTLGGYSTIWLARALPPDGELITLEADANYAELARANIARAGFSDRVEVRHGLALETLPLLESDPPFDMIFIDADKDNNPPYFEWSLKLSRPGTLIVVDNVVRDGAVIDPESTKDGVRGTRRLFEMLAAEKRINATAIQTVGSKGHDGFALVLVTP